MIISLVSFEKGQLEKLLFVGLSMMNQMKKLLDSIALVEHSVFIYLPSMADFFLIKLTI
jgi:hypothetical protein